MTTCDVCERPVDGTAYACTGCATRAVEQLATIAGLADAARDVVHGLTRHGPAIGGAGGAGRIPVNLGAGGRVDAVQAELTTWGRAVHEQRGGQLGTGDPIAVAAAYLADEVEWIRHQQFAAELLSDVATAHRVILGVVDPPAGRRYLGPCRGELEDGAECAGDVYARDGAREGRCRDCGSRHAVAERRAWLDGEVRRWSYTAAEISAAYGIPGPTLRTWAHRGEIQPNGEHRGRPTYELGPVLDLAAGKAARREAARSRREARLTMANDGGRAA